MAAVADGDVSIAENGDIRWTGLTSVYNTGLELHEWHQSKSDDQASTGDDEADMTDGVISVRTTDNNFTLLPPYNIDQAMSEQIYDGSISQLAGQELYTALEVIGNVNLGTTELIIAQDGAALTSWWGTGINTGTNILLRTLVKIKTAGAMIDSGILRVYAREFQDTYAFFETSPNLTGAGGKTIAAIFTDNDKNNNTAVGTVATWAADITWTFGYDNTININNGSGARAYGLVADLDTPGPVVTVNDAKYYEVTKWICRRGNTTLYGGVQGQLTRGVANLEIDYDTIASGPFVEGDPCEFSNGGKGIIKAADNPSGSGALWVELTSGLAPTNTDTIVDATGDTNNTTANITTVTARPVINAAPFGTQAGTLFEGSYGHAITDLDAADSKTYTIIDLTNATQTPPNNVSLVVANTISGDTVQVVRRRDVANTAAAGTIGDLTLTTQAAIDTDNPTFGIVTVTSGGTPRSYFYSSYTGSVFTLVSPLVATVTAADPTEVRSLIKNENTLNNAGATNNQSGAGTVVVTNTIGTDVPAAGWIRLLVPGSTRRFALYPYSSHDGANTYTLDAVTLTETYTDLSDMYTPLIDAISAGASVTQTIVQSVSIPTRCFVRNQSDALVPFEQDLDIGANGLTYTVIRNPDA